jgi:hypothetical protein
MKQTFEELIFPIMEALVRVEKNGWKTSKIHCSQAYIDAIKESLDELGGLQETSPDEANTNVILGYEYVVDQPPEGDWWLETDEIIPIPVLHKLKHVLEFGVGKNPSIDYSREWLDLMREYRKHGNKANEAYCRNMAGLPSITEANQTVSIESKE